MNSLITIVCYKFGEIIDGSNDVSYSCLLEKCVLVDNMITYDELDDKLCCVMLIERSHTKFIHGFLVSNIDTDRK